jgi:hypothetical protein
MPKSEHGLGRSVEEATITSMSHAPRSAEWWRKDAERNERARRARLRRDAAKPSGTNLEEGSELAHFAHEFARAFERVRSR